MGGRARPLGWTALPLIVALAAPRAAAGPDPSQLAERAATADPAELVGLARQLAPAPGPDPPGTAWLAAAADALGVLVSRARALDASADAFRALSTSGDGLAEAIETARRMLEDARFEDEQALEALYRSLDWQRVGYAAASVAYWRGWAQLGLGHRLPAGAERDAALRTAREAFARSARALSLPEIAKGSLLGLGLCDLELGELDEARAALERLDAALEAGDPTGLRTPALQALLAVRVRQGDIEGAGELASQIPREVLSERERLELLALEAEVALEAARKGDGDAELAAQRVRELASHGGEAALAANQLAVRYRQQLAGRDLGALGDLLAADEAFREGRWEAARDAYARALGAARSIEGLDTALARYRYGIALHRTGAQEQAASQLEHALAEAGDPALEREIAAAWYAVCEERARADPGSANEARAARAARALIRLAPDAPQSAEARVRAARGLESGGDERAALRELEQVDPRSPAAATALLEAVRMRANRLQRRENAGNVPDAAEARRLAADLDAARGLELDPSQEAALGVLRAKAATWAGESPAAVAERVSRARAAPGLDADGRRSLRRVELRSWVAAGDYRALQECLDGLADEELRRDWDVFAELLADMPRTPEAAPTWESWYRRLGPLAPPASREGLELDRAQRLLGTGRAREAGEVAQRLVDADPTWAEARILRARALEAAGDEQAAADAWERLAASLDPGSPEWVEAQLALARGAERRGDSERACAAARAILESGAELSADARAALERPRCPP